VFVVHAVWLGAGRLVVWAEDSTEPPVPPRRPGRRPQRQPHPFAVSHDGLAELLVEQAAKAVTSTVRLALPTRGGGPIESPELIRDEVPTASAATTAGSSSGSNIRMIRVHQQYGISSTAAYPEYPVK